MNKPESGKTQKEAEAYLLSVGATTIDSLCNAGGFIPHRPEPGTSTSTDNAPEPRAAGIKHDSDRQLAGILYEDFPHALSGIADAATFGARKYTRNGWRTVPDGLQRYTDAMHRHLLAAAKGEVCDPESGLLHMYHVAWNALAITELMHVQEPKP